MSEFVERMKNIHPLVRYFVIALIVVALVLLVIYLLTPVQMGVFSNITNNL
jgi:uncharacterized membrane protein